MKKGWPIKKLGDVCEIIMGQSPDGESYNTTGEGVPLINGPVEFSADSFGKTVRTKFTTQPTKFCKEGDLILCVRGSTTGRMNIAGFDACIGRGVAAIRAKQYQPWINHFISSKRDEIHGKGTGATFPNVSGASLANFELAIPPLPEQQRIVAILDEAFAGIATAKANTEKNLQNARAIFESYLCSVFKQSGEGWVEKTLGEIGKVSMCKRIFKEETLTKAGIPFYKIGTFGKEPDSFIPARIYDEYKQNYPFPKKGDVLISASGTIGRRVKYDGKPAYFQDSNIVWIENDEKQVLNDYLYHFYGACEWNSTKGATISRLYNDNLRRIVITFPESFQEQRQIVGQLDVLTSETQRLATVYQQKLTTLDELKKSLLHQAFSGEL